MEARPDILELVERIRSAQSSFYRDLWSDERRFDRLHPVRRTDFIRVPLSARRYKDDAALVKTVRCEDGMFLTEWSFDDIAAQTLAPTGVRPMVYMEDADDALDKSLWCYEHDLLPLIGETVPEIANSAADFYDIDSLIADQASVKKLIPHLRRRNRPLTHLNVLGTVFNSDILKEYGKFATHITLTLSLPETGPFASAPYAGTPRFSVFPDCFVETGETLLLTKASFLTTPIIRYALPVSGIEFV